MIVLPRDIGTRMRRLFGCGSVLIGLAVMVGWLLDLEILKNFSTGFTTTKANSALGLIAAGSGTMLVGAGAGHPRWRGLAGVLASCAGVVALLLGALTLIEYGFGLHLGLDEWLIADPHTTSPPYPGRMSPATAIALLCAGTAILLLSRAAALDHSAVTGRRRLVVAGHLLTVVPAAIAYLSLTEYACRIAGRYSLGAFVVVALPTALGFALVAAAAFYTLPDLGWRRALVDRPAAQKVFARLLSIALVLPVLTGVIVVWGARTRIYDPLYGQALFALAVAVALTTMALIGAAVVQQAEGRLLDINAKLATSEAELRRLNESLEVRVREEVAAREAAQVRLAHGQRMEALGQLAGGVAHDFNNVMQAVQGGAGLIRRRTGDPQAVDHLARMMEDTIRRGASITRRLLSFARRGELRAERVNPASLLADLQDVLVHTLGTDIAVEIETSAPRLPTLLADKGQLETVLINLATNARDAMATGGALILAAAEQVFEPGGSYAADSPPAGHYVRLTVSDSGQGMAPEVLARACEPFFTTKPQGKGTGLGLAMARGFAEQSGGALAIRSTPGAGTTVTLWLPVTTRAAPVSPSTSLPPRSTATNAVRLMVVDDEDLVREVLADGLEERGYEVLRASDAGAALAMLDAGAVVSLLLTDYTMPGMDGLSLIEAARERLAGLPAVLLTGNASVQTKARTTLDGGVAGFKLLRKPIQAQKLADCIESLLQQAASKV